MQDQHIMDETKLLTSCGDFNCFLSGIIRAPVPNSRLAHSLIPNSSLVRALIPNSRLVHAIINDSRLLSALPKNWLRRALTQN